LNSKQRAIAEATRDKSKKITRRKGATKTPPATTAPTLAKTISEPTDAAEKMPKVVKVKKEKPKKEPKEASWVESFRMFGDGLTPATIAERRGYAESTVWGHLAKAMQDGKLDIHDLLDDSTIDSITKAIESFDGVPTMTEIRERLRNKVSYNEIRIVLTHLNP
ncbi:helix-turn-helix domain-containing protein, partial [Muribaculum sp.]|uniref:helix-turn-helix domain-containing protein n=1 Tax=Muribaculum sp. TaxID=1918611 RepID=UPI0023C2D9B4